MERFKQNEAPWVNILSQLVIAGHVRDKNMFLHKLKGTFFMCHSRRCNGEAAIRFYKNNLKVELHF